MMNRKIIIGLIVIVFLIAVYLLFYYQKNKLPISCGEDETYSLDWTTCVPDPNKCHLIPPNECEENPNCKIVTVSGTAGCPTCEIISVRCFPK